MAARTLIHLHLLSPHSIHLFEIPFLPQAYFYPGSTHYHPYPLPNVQPQSFQLKVQPAPTTPEFSTQNQDTPLRKYIKQLYYKPQSQKDYNFAITLQSLLLNLPNFRQNLETYQNQILKTLRRYKYIITAVPEKRKRKRKKDSNFCADFEELMHHLLPKGQRLFNPQNKVDNLLKDSETQVDYNE